MDLSVYKNKLVDFIGWKDGLPKKIAFWVMMLSMMMLLLCQFYNALDSVDELAVLTEQQQAMDLGQLREELVRTRAHHYLIIRRWSMVIYVVYAVGAVIWVWLALKRKQRRDEYYFQIGENIREITQLKQSENENTARLLHELLTREYRLMDEKCREYYERASYMNKKGVSNEAEEMIERLSSAEQQAELEAMVNKYQANVMADFRRDLPGLKAADYSLFLYSILGFSPTAISIFLHTDKLEAIYNRKARLKAKIRQIGDERQQQKYLSYL